MQYPVQQATLTVSKNHDLSSPAIFENIAGTTYTATQTQALDAGTLYFWAVTATNDGGSAKSSTR
jgi:hypothetical protein